MAHHISNETLICYLVAFSISKKADLALGHILGTHEMDIELLNELRAELLLEPYRPLSIRDTLMRERDVCILELSRMTYDTFVECAGPCMGDSEEDRKILRRARKLLDPLDPDVLNQAIKYLENYYNTLLSSIEKPYLQAFEEIGTGLEKIQQESDAGNDQAFIVSMFVPALRKCYNFKILWETDYHALLTALDVYIEKGKTGALPDKLPNASYPDAFSRKPFVYEVTANGFVLTCQQEDLIHEKMQEYRFILP
jgi:hypothetical protein